MLWEGRECSASTCVASPALGQRGSGCSRGNFSSNPNRNKLAQRGTLKLGAPQLVFARSLDLEMAKPTPQIWGRVN